MTGKVQSNNDELAKRRTIIDTIGMSIEQFDRSLSDKHKVAMFAMPIKGLEELRRNLRTAKNGLQVSWMIATAISPPDNNRPEESHPSLKPVKAGNSKVSVVRRPR